MLTKVKADFHFILIFFRAKTFLEWELDGLNFQPISPVENIFWSYSCDFTGDDVGSEATAIAADCGAMCLSNMDCTHFAWNEYNGGTCWMKGVSSLVNPFERHDKKNICGWVERP